MPTREEVDAIHEALDGAGLALEDLITARVTGNEAMAKDAIDRVSRGLGDCKEALRVVHVGGLTMGQATIDGDERVESGRLRMIEYAAESRSKAQEHMVAVAAGALAITVTFREVVVQSAPQATWLLKASWVALAACVVCIIAERLATSMRITVHAFGGTAPAKPEAWMLAVPHLLSLIGFGVGFVALVALGWLNL